MLAERRYVRHIRNRRKSQRVVEFVFYKRHKEVDYEDYLRLLPTLKQRFSEMPTGHLIDVETKSPKEVLDDATDCINPWYIALCETLETRHESPRLQHQIPHAV